MEEKTLTEKYFIFEEKLGNFRKNVEGKTIFLSSIAIHIVTKNEKYNFEYDLRSVKFNWAVILCDKLGLLSYSQADLLSMNDLKMRCPNGTRYFSNMHL